MRRLIPVLIIPFFLFSCGVSQKECLKKGCTWACREKPKREFVLYETTALGEAVCIVKDIKRALTPRCRCVCPKEKEEAKEKEKQEEPEYTAP